MPYNLPPSVKDYNDCRLTVYELKNIVSIFFLLYAANKTVTNKHANDTCRCCNVTMYSNSVEEET